MIILISMCIMIALMIAYFRLIFVILPTIIRFLFGVFVIVFQIIGFLFLLQLIGNLFFLVDVLAIWVVLGLIKAIV